MKQWFYTLVCFLFGVVFLWYWFGGKTPIEAVLSVFGIYLTR